MSLCGVTFKRVSKTGMIMTDIRKMINSKDVILQHVHTHAFVTLIFVRTLGYYVFPKAKPLS